MCGSKQRLEENTCRSTMVHTSPYLCDFHKVVNQFFGDARWRGAQPRGVRDYTAPLWMGQRRPASLMHWLQNSGTTGLKLARRLTRTALFKGSLAIITWFFTSIFTPTISARLYIQIILNNFVFVQGNGFYQMNLPISQF